MSSATKSKSVRNGSFEEWMADVDRRVTSRLGLSVHDLADMGFRDAFEDGTTSAAFASHIVRNKWDFI